MKAIFSILAICFVLITATIVFIIRSGVSIRTAPIIKPSIISPDFNNVFQGISLRLFPDFQQAEFVLWGIPESSLEAQNTLSQLQKKVEAEMGTSISILRNGLTATQQDIQNCARPCWVLLPEDSAHELTANMWVNENLRPSGSTYFTITWVQFNRTSTVPEYCTKEKRLDLECLKKVSIQEVSRKIKAPDRRYFFMRKYLDRDYFLFIEEPKNP